ncbi:radical SAM protein [Sellimonas intestinalis]|uniref:Radical SAM protein n=5 Tax=Sellimonas intestinalis TaxID=1653434 RepID=A0A3E3K0R3_9FIRM|nr:radical SAM protein [Sellimonas intestinalis]RGD37244.1 radical SAM protein [Sellimonas intestinalis]RGE50790.1 radical SAM protein [Sellimonas intestinalis]RGE53855.1 radical SAM protein [Sellimonas intestinalis]RGE60083.1 radical SAM protein [Sellimonas intestinalis]
MSRSYLCWKMKNDFLKVSWRKIEMSVFDITNRCNLKCIYCCRGESLNKQVDEVSTEDVLNTIKQIVDIRGNFIVLQGGEPLIRKDIVDILSKMKEYKKVIPAKYFNDLKNLLKLQLPAERFGMQYKKILVRQGLPMYFVSTNGTIYSKNIEKALYESGFAVDISLDSFDKEINERTRIGINHDTVCENIKKFSERLPVSISCTVTEENVDTIDEMIDYAYRFGAISVKYSPVIMVGNRKENDENFRFRYLKALDRILDIFPNYSEKLYLTIKIYKHCLNDSYGKAVLEKILATPNIMLEIHECAACIKLKELYIDPKLNVYGCASMKNDPSLSLGNLYEKTLVDLWKSEKRLYLKQQLSKHIEQAGKYGGCTASSYIIQKDTRRQKDD